MRSKKINNKKQIIVCINLYDLSFSVKSSLNKIEVNKPTLNYLLNKQDRKNKTYVIWKISFLPV